jgi:apolipoprotein N-acyltransferase
MVRAVNSGVSALIDPNGRLLAKTHADDPYRHPLPADGILVDAPRMLGGDTVYAKYGDWFVYLCILGLAAMGALAERARTPRVNRATSQDNA